MSDYLEKSYDKALDELFNLQIEKNKLVIENVDLKAELANKERETAEECLSMVGRYSDYELSIRERFNLNKQEGE